MNKSLAAALLAGLFLSGTALASYTTPVAEPIAIKFKGVVETKNCRVTVGTESDNTIVLGNIAINANGQVVPVDLHFSDCIGRSITSFKLTSAAQTNEEGVPTEIEDGKLPTNLKNVKVGLFKNDNNTAGAAVNVNENLVDEPIEEGTLSNDFTWRPMYAQLLGEQNTETGEVQAVGYFELKYN